VAVDETGLPCVPLQLDLFATAFFIWRDGMPQTTVSLTFEEVKQIIANKYHVRDDCVSVYYKNELKIMGCDGLEYGVGKNSFLIDVIVDRS